MAVYLKEMEVQACVNLIVERGAYGPRLFLWVTDGRRANGDSTVEATIFCLLSLIQIC